MLIGELTVEPDSRGVEQVQQHELTSVSGSTLTLTAVAVGSATLSVTGNDPDGLSASRSVGVTVGDGGTQQPPRASGSIRAQTLTAGGSPGSVNVAPYFTDPDGDRLTYSARSSAQNTVSVSVSGSAVRLRPVATGTATVTVTSARSGRFDGHAAHLRDSGEQRQRERVQRRAGADTRPELHEPRDPDLHGAQRRMRVVVGVWRRQAVRRVNQRERLSGDQGRRCELRIDAPP